MPPRSELPEDRTSEDNEYLASRQIDLSNSVAKTACASKSFRDAGEPSAAFLEELDKLPPALLAHPLVWDKIADKLKMPLARSSGNDDEVLKDAALRSAVTGAWKVLVDSQNTRLVIEDQCIKYKDNVLERLADANEVTTEEARILETDDGKPSNDLSRNLDRVRPGITIGVFYLERTSNKQLDFETLNAMSSPTGPAHSRYCLNHVNSVSGFKAKVLRYATMDGKGFKVVPTDAYDEWIPVFGRGQHWELPGGVTTALISENHKEREGSMLHLIEEEIDLRDWIFIHDRVLTVESTVRLHDLLLKNKHIRKTIGGLLEYREISSSLAKSSRSNPRELTREILDRQREFDEQFDLRFPASGGAARPTAKAPPYAQPSELSLQGNQMDAGAITPGAVITTIHGNFNNIIITHEPAAVPPVLTQYNDDRSLRAEILVRSQRESQERDHQGRTFQNEQEGSQRTPWYKTTREYQDRDYAATRRGRRDRDNRRERSPDRASIYYDRGLFDNRYRDRTSPIYGNGSTTAASSSYYRTGTASRRSGSTRPGAEDAEYDGRFASFGDKTNRRSG